MKLVLINITYSTSESSYESADPHSLAQTFPVPKTKTMPAKDGVKELEI